MPFESRNMRRRRTIIEEGTVTINVEPWMTLETRDKLFTDKANSDVTGIHWEEQEQVGEVDILSDSINRPLPVVEAIPKDH